MSKYIGKRVSYPCGQCEKQITLSKRTIDDSNNSGEVFCSEKCFEQFRLAHVVGQSEQLTDFWCGERAASKTQCNEQCTSCADDV